MKCLSASFILARHCIILIIGNLTAQQSPCKTGAKVVGRAFEGPSCHIWQILSKNMLWGHRKFTGNLMIMIYPKYLLHHVNYNAYCALIGQHIPWYWYIYIYIYMWKVSIWYLWNWKTCRFPVDITDIFVYFHALLPFKQGPFTRFTYQE